ncbi:MAG: uracil-DNA glycosylase family protein [Cellvibrionaceae bacterium]
MRNNKLTVITSDVKKCTLCKDSLPLGLRPVLQVDHKAKILIAGQAPGIKVHKSGIPFDDPSGERLREWMGIDNKTFYNAKKIAILPMGFCYPGTGKSGDLPPRPECADKWRDQLLENMLNIELILVIGTYAQKWHMKARKKPTLTETVKNWQDYWPALLPLPHPSPRNNIWLSKNPWFDKEIIPQLQKRVRVLI